MSIWEYERRQAQVVKEYLGEPEPRRLWRVLVSNMFYILAGAFFGYVIVFALGIAAIVCLDAAGVRYSDTTGAYVISAFTFGFLILGGWAGLRHGERR